MTEYTFHRKGGFYMIELENDEAAVRNAEVNEGTVRVTNCLHQTIWEAPFKSICGCIKQARTTAFLYCDGNCVWNPTGNQ